MGFKLDYAIAQLDDACNEQGAWEAIQASRQSIEDHLSMLLAKEWKVSDIEYDYSG